MTYIQYTNEDTEMRKYQHIVGFGMFLIISSIIISISLHLFYNLHKEPEYGNYPAEFTGTFVRIRKEQSRNYYYVLVNYENKIRVMRMFLDKVIIQDTEKKEIQLSDIHTGDTIKVNFLGDIVASNPEIITKIQTLTLLEQNRETDIEALIKLIPGGRT